MYNLTQDKMRVTYNQTRHFRLNESFSESNVGLDEPLHLLNPVGATIVGATRGNAQFEEPQTQAVMYGTMNKLLIKYNESLVLNTTARQALLGRPAPILGRLRSLIDTFGVKGVRVQMLEMRDNKFGYVHVNNGSWDGPFEVYTGYQASAGHLGDLNRYEGRQRQTIYQGKCNRLKASLGELRPIPVGKNQPLEIFMPRLCRVVHLVPLGVLKQREGLAIDYIISPADLLSADANPDNRCYCVNGTANNYCSLNGIIELGPCAQHAPVLLGLSSIAPDQRVMDTVANSNDDYVDELLRNDVSALPANTSNHLLVLRRLGLTIQADITMTLFIKLEQDARFR